MLYVKNLVTFRIIDPAALEQNGNAAPAFRGQAHQHASRRGQALTKRGLASPRAGDRHSHQDGDHQDGDRHTDLSAPFVGPVEWPEWASAAS